ncbi:hypothetical protein GCM10011380_19680 [Sphingomonas metalli]|uniref:Uncharacterized protein n=1 Tax=Sphingomonas metalli TaxID=1779358 RepID=A0A916T4F9_9SPHN|nr:hypothetical protein GCM10011380_19680 [Sphingomonas metalli]
MRTCAATGAAVSTAAITQPKPMPRMPETHFLPRTGRLDRPQPCPALNKDATERLIAAATLVIRCGLPIRRRG